MFHRSKTATFQRSLPCFSQRLYITCLFVSWRAIDVVHFTSATAYLSPAIRVTAMHCVLCGATKVLSLKNNGISACLVGGSSDLRTEEKAIAGEFPLVFVTPEKVPSLV